MKTLTSFAFSVLLFIGAAAQQPGSTTAEHTRRPQFFIAGGMAVNSLKITGSKTFLETQIDHKPTVSPVLAAGVKFYSKHNEGRFLVMPTLRFYSIDIKGDIQLTSGLANYSHESSFKSKLVISPAGNIGFKIISRPGVQWHVSAGLGALFLIKATDTQLTKYSSGDQALLQKKPDPMVFCFNGQTGIDFGKNLGIWLYYQPYANTTEYSSKFVKTSSLQAGLSWGFHSAK